MDLKSILDKARQSILVIDMRSQSLNFTAWKRTLQATNVTSAEKRWRISAGDRRARHDVREASKSGRLALFTDLVWYDLTQDGHMTRCGALRTIPVSIDDTCTYAIETGPPVENRELFDLLEKLGATATLTPGGFKLTHSGPARARLDEESRIGAALTTSRNAAAYLDHFTNPAVLTNSLLRFFVEGPLLRAATEATDLFETASPTPANERTDEVEASEPPPKAVSKSRMDPANECSDVVGPSERQPKAVPATDHPLDPDQAEATRLALTGISMIIDGPPGTGKSQVIAAIAEQIIASGLRAIITSTENSALEVAARRLRNLSKDHGILISTPEGIAAHQPSCIGIPDFDLVIIDECSRMLLEEALPLLVRGKAVILIGDDRQMRPDKAGETILDRGRSLGLHRVSLRFHYRSRDPSLIGASNLIAYDMALRTVPTPDRKRSNGVKLVDLFHGSASRVTAGTINVAEAEAIVAKLKELRDSGDRRSIGVITANSAQQMLLKKLVSEAGLSDDARTKADIEPTFIRPVQLVQGEERDIVLISTVYDGRASPDRFGSFDGPGAIERLNVMLSRSRFEMWIYTSFRRTSLRTGPTPTRGRLAYEAMRIVIDEMTQAETRLPVPVDIQHTARRLNLTVEKLGVVYGFRERTNSRYEVGLVVTDDTKTEAHWAAIKSQLKAVGWTVATVSKDDLRARPTDADAALRKAMTSAPPPKS